jgi:hypothetical protein
MKVDSKYTSQEIQAMSMKEIKRLKLPKYSIVFHGTHELSIPFTTYLIDDCRRLWKDAKQSGKYIAWKLYQEDKTGAIAEGNF